MERQLDKLDRVLLNFLQQDARISMAELARRVELSPPGLQKRLRKLEEQGIINNYATLVDHEAVGYDMLCLVQVSLQRHAPGAVEDFHNAIQNMPEVLECYHITGEYDYHLKVVIRNRKHLRHFIVEMLTPITGMDKVRTSLVLSRMKSTTAVPI